MSNKYEEGKVYTIRCKLNPEYVYVGSLTLVSCVATSSVTGSQHSGGGPLINENFGWQEVDITVLGTNR